MFVALRLNTTVTLRLFSQFVSAMDVNADNRIGDDAEEQLTGSYFDHVNSDT